MLCLCPPPLGSDRWNPIGGIGSVEVVSDRLFLFTDVDRWGLLPELLPPRRTRRSDWWERCSEEALRPRPPAVRLPHGHGARAAGLAVRQAHQERARRVRTGNARVLRGRVRLLTSSASSPSCFRARAHFSILCCSKYIVEFDRLDSNPGNGGPRRREANDAFKPTIPGGIYMGVYRAVKRRLANMPVRFRMMG